MRKLIGTASFMLLLAMVICWPAKAQGPTPHSITLTWTPSTTSGVTAQKVYRSTTSGGPYTAIASLGPSVTSYVDSSGSGGTKYYYVVTALAGSNESAPSNEVNAVFLANPAPPTGLGAAAN